MLFIGLTGGIGSGKSEALAACRRAGAAVLSSDQVVHDLLATGEVKELLVARWGEDVLSNGEIDRAAVAEIVFDKPDQLQWLEQNLFPLVGAEIAAWRVELEASGEPPRVADEQLRAERAAARDHRAVDERAARQLSQDEKANRAHHVIRNDGSLDDLERDIRDLLDRLAGEAARS